MTRRVRIGPFVLLLAAVLLTAVAPPPAPAADDAAAVDSLFRAGNRAYQEGHFDDAIGHYEAIRASGLENGALYYNLGNAYFRTESYGLAAANYERAGRFLPRDPDLRENRRILGERTLDGELAGRRIPPWQLFLTIAGLLTLSEWLVVAEVLYGLTIAGLALALFRPRLGSRLREPVVVLGLLTLVAGGLLAVSWHEERGIERAAVVSSEVAGRSGPGSQFTQEFLVHEGTLVRVHRERGNWLLCSLSAEIRGWLPESALERI